MPHRGGRLPTVPRSWIHHDRRQDLTRLVHDPAVIRPTDSYASTPADAFINPRQRPFRQFSNASIASKRPYHDDDVAHGGAFAPYAAVLA